MTKEQRDLLEWLASSREALFRPLSVAGMSAIAFALADMDRMVQELDEAHREVEAEQERHDATKAERDALLVRAREAGAK